MAIRNPLSEKFAVLRPSLAPGLVESLQYNLNRQCDDVRLFEVGSVFATGRGERPVVGWVISGSRGAHWSAPGSAVTFADAKGIAELLAESFRVPLDVGSADEAGWLVRGQRATMLTGGEPVGWIGRLATGVPAGTPVFAGEVDLAVLGAAAARAPRAITPLPRFPSVVRDLSILVDERLPAAEVRGTIRSNAPATLVSVREFDRYQGKGVPAGQISLSMRLTFRHGERTLTDAEVQQAVDAIVEALGRANQATLRGR